MSWIQAFNQPYPGALQYLQAGGLLPTRQQNSCYPGLAQAIGLAPGVYGQPAAGTVVANYGAPRPRLPGARWRRASNFQGGVGAIGPAIGLSPLVYGVPFPGYPSLGQQQKVGVSPAEAEQWKQVYAAQMRDRGVVANPRPRDCETTYNERGIRTTCCWTGPNERVCETSDDRLDAELAAQGWTRREIRVPPRPRRARRRRNGCAQESPWMPTAGYGTGQYGSQYGPNANPAPCRDLDTGDVVDCAGAPEGSCINNRGCISVAVDCATGRPLRLPMECPEGWIELHDTAGDVTGCVPADTGCRRVPTSVSDKCPPGTHLHGYHGSDDGEDLERVCCPYPLPPGVELNQATSRSMDRASIRRRARMSRSELRRERTTHCDYFPKDKWGPAQICCGSGDVYEDGDCLDLVMPGPTVARPGPQAVRLPNLCVCTNGFVHPKYGWICTEHACEQDGHVELAEHYETVRRVPKKSSRLVRRIRARRRMQARRANLIESIAQIPEPWTIPSAGGGA